jgi:hypothetical protein
MFSVCLYVYSAENRDPIAAVVIPLLAIFFLVLTIKAFLIILRYHRYRRNVSGRVTTLERREVRGGLCAEIIVAEYTVDGHTYTIRSAFSYGYSYYRTGDGIPLRVSERDNERAMMPYDLKDARKGVLICGIVSLLMFVASF